MAIKRKKAKGKVRGRGKASKAKVRAAAPKRSRRPAKSRVGKGAKGTARKSSARSRVRGRRY